MNVFDEAYKKHGVRAQRSYPNESLIQFLASQHFDAPIEKRSAVRVLEVGCGSGANLWMVAKEGFSAYGIDFSAAGIEVARQHLRHKWGVSACLGVGSFTALPYKADYFDVVVDVVSLQHLDLANSAIALAEVARVLKAGQQFFSYRLSDRSVMDDAGVRIDSATIENISDSQLPLSGNGLTSFWSASTAREMYHKAGLQLTSVERVGRTYRNGMFVEYLTLIARKK